MDNLVMLPQQPTMHHSNSPHVHTNHHAEKI